MRKFLVLFFCALFLQSPYSASAQENSKMREFLISATYGTLVGALVGAASLAFEDEPGENLQRIARGASLGLYAGIGLGIYVTQYYDPNAPMEELEPLPEEEPIPGVDVMYFEPIFHEKKLDGLKANLTLLSF